MDAQEAIKRKHEIMRSRAYLVKEDPGHVGAVETVLWLNEVIARSPKEPSRSLPEVKPVHGKNLEAKSVGATTSKEHKFIAREDAYQAKELKDSIFNNPADPLYAPYRDKLHPLHAKAVREVEVLNDIIVGKDNKSITVNARECVYDTSQAYKGPK